MAANDTGPTEVRTAAKAVILRDGHLLTIKVKDLLYQGRVYYALPGGGQDPGENLHETLRRECLEEVGAVVDVGDLLYVREYIGPNHEYAAVDGEFQQIDLIFACKLVDDTHLGNGSAPDDRQLAVEWLRLDRLDEYYFRPQTLIPLLQQLPRRQPTYLGDVN